MNLEIIAVGTELLLGDIVNTNAAWLAKELANIGINVYRHEVVGDNMNRLQAAYGEAFSRSDAVIVTGGLGPTADDITKEAAAAYFGLEMDLDEKSLAKISEFFSRIGHNMTQNNRKQAVFPRGSHILSNPNGTAPGCIIEQDGKICILLPGPPREMKAMFDTHVRPYLTTFSDGILVSRTLHLVGIGESAMEDKIADILQNQTNPTIAPYATSRAGECILRISAKSADEMIARDMMIPVADTLYERLGEYIYGEDDDTLAQIIVSRMTELGLTLAAAESITGGAFAAAIIDVAGASRIICESVVCYSNDSKIARLGVSSQSLAKYGAVSEQVAREMAEGAAKSANTDIAISFTGIAGPDGGTDTKPVGLCYIGLYHNGHCKVVEHRLFGDRKRIRDRAVAHGMDMLRRRLNEVN
ncbi:MAG: competence/damage-inducible protein A [Defluviitaleaceae bacterium]|nr:competence/damage-inducible protein A [Defluviitaleaceae bacterium]